MLPPCEARGQDVVLNIFRTGWATQDAAELFSLTSQHRYRNPQARCGNVSEFFAIDINVPRASEGREKVTISASWRQAFLPCLPLAKKSGQVWVGSRRGVGTRFSTREVGSLLRRSRGAN